MREMERMEAGLWYDANYDQELVKARRVAQDKYFEYNQLKPSEEAKKQAVLSELFGYKPDKVNIAQPFYCDYGTKIKLTPLSYLDYLLHNLQPSLPLRSDRLHTKSLFQGCLQL